MSSRTWAVLILSAVFTIVGLELGDWLLEHSPRLLVPIVGLLSGLNVSLAWARE